MNALIPVLAILDEVSEGTTLMTREQCRRLREARVAVAELIEVTDIALGWVNGPTKAEKEIRDRIRAGLARVRGAA